MRKITIEFNDKKYNPLYIKTIISIALKEIETAQKIHDKEIKYDYQREFETTLELPVTVKFNFDLHEEGCKGSMGEKEEPDVPGQITDIEIDFKTLDEEGLHELLDDECWEELEKEDD